MKKNRSFLKYIIGFLVVIALFSIPVVQATSVSTHTITYDIGLETVDVTHKLVFTQDLEENEVLSIPRDAKELLIISEKKTIEPIFDKGAVSIPKGIQTVIITYSSIEILQDASTHELFFTQHTVLQPTTSLIITAILPPASTLTNPIDEGTSIFPTPTTVTTDGQRTSIIWEHSDLKTGETIAYLVDYIVASTFPIIPVLVIIVVISLIGFIFYKRRKPKQAKKVEKEPIKEEKVKTPSFEAHLKSDEKEIVRLLRQKGGKCQQSTLVVITGHSKAQLSRMLQEMESRQIIKKTTKGNKNIIVLNENIEELDEI
ncbi:hypothetical protein CL622_00210 [archaeon]|nr:hypothetical protein [archaeon]|tara:strand:+ start:1752 stop:2696 length:945 start_codon:yes stop_codon:yes gene_type:complete